MFATGKYLKDSAANARRAATTLRHLADSTETSIADRGVMLTAAAIVDGIANKTAKLGKERKASEEKYERERRAAVVEAEKLMLAALPATSILDKVALVACAPRRRPYLTEDLDKGSDAASLMRSLDYWANDTRREMAHEAAGNALRKKTRVADAFLAVQDIFAKRLADGAVVRLAERFSATITPTPSEAA